MLASWFRMKYPHLVDGVIAASAPIWTYLGEVPEVRSRASGHPGHFLLALVEQSIISYQ